MKRKIAILLGCAVLAAALAGCGATAEQTDPNITTGITDTGVTAAAEPDARTGATVQAPGEGGSEAQSRPEGGFPGGGQTVTTGSASDGPILSADDEFSNRDMEQTPDLSEAKTLTLVSGQDVTVTEAGIYVLTGSVKNVTVTVEAGDEDKVQLVLDNVSIENEDFPCIYVKNADKTFITTAEGSVNTLAVTGSFRADGDTNTDAAGFSRDDLTLNGLGTLSVSSTDNGVSCKDDLKVTGGTLNVTCESDALAANDSVRIAGGEISLVSGEDGIHSENDEDETLGYVYISGGTLSIRAGDDAVHATTVLQMDDGTLTLQASEGLEGTYVQLNGGSISISASDDGINAARKSTAYTPTIEVNGGSITVKMGSGDTDALDANGNLYINGGTLDITAQSPFDYDGVGELNGGSVTVNGQEVTVLTNQFGGMGGGFGSGAGEMPEGGFGGSMGGRPGGGAGEMPEGGFGGGICSWPGSGSGEMPEGGFGGGMGGRPGGGTGEMPEGGFGGSMGGRPGGSTGELPEGGMDSQEATAE